MEYLLGGCGSTLKTSPPIVKEKKPFGLPPKNDSMRRAFAYLTKTRGVDKDVLQVFADRNMIYESADYHNAVFIGYDRNGVPRHAHKRDTGQVGTYRGNVDSCVPEYSFHWHGTSDKGILKVLNGIIVGKPAFKSKLESYKEVYKRVVGFEAGLPDLPILYNVNVGHAYPIGVFPLGLTYEIDCDNKTLRLMEPATK